MANIYTSTWSETAANNNSSPPDGFPENMSYAAVNNAAREMMAALKREWNLSHPTLTTGGTSTAITLTPSTAATAYASGQVFGFVLTTTCGDNATLNVSTLGAKKIYINSTSGPVQVAASDMIAGNYYQAAYISTLDSSAGGFLLLGAYRNTSTGNGGAGGTASAGVGTAYDICFDFGQTPIDAADRRGAPLPRTITFPANFTGTAVSVGTSPAATSTFTIYRGVGGSNTQIGTIAISTNLAVTYSTTGGLSVTITGSAGCYLFVDPPSPADASLQQVWITLKGEVA